MRVPQSLSLSTPMNVHPHPTNNTPRAIPKVPARTPATASSTDPTIEPADTVDRDVPKPIGQVHIRLEHELRRRLPTQRVHQLEGRQVHPGEVQPGQQRAGSEGASDRGQRWRPRRRLRGQRRDRRHQQDRSQGEQRIPGGDQGRVLLVKSQLLRGPEGLAVEEGQFCRCEVRQLPGEETDRDGTEPQERRHNQCRTTDHQSRLPGALRLPTRCETRP